MWHVCLSTTGVQLQFERIEADIFMMLICDLQVTVGFWIPLFLAYLIFQYFYVIRRVFSIHELVFGTRQEETGFPPENSDQDCRVLHMLVGDFSEYSPKAVQGLGAELSITCSFEKLNEKQCKYSGFPGFNLRTLSCTNGWYLPSHANSALQPALDFLHRTSLLKPITSASIMTPPERLCSGVARR